MKRNPLSRVECAGRIDPSVWTGPIPELDRTGSRTGYAYVRCRDCGAEALTADRDHGVHYAGCAHR